MTTLLALCLLAAGSWVLRITFVTLRSPEALPAVVRSGLDYIGPAVTAGLIVVLLAGGEGPTGLRLSPGEVAALGAGAAAALRGAGLLPTIAIGMAALWVVDLLILA
jgi:branched-subunit amino acid transport protein